ncbi:MAG: hypothetical protein GX567_15030, partial [Clostridia bacterium]|nr:hypothetical protein [Clostridia bacterium]
MNKQTNVLSQKEIHCKLNKEHIFIVFEATILIAICFLHALSSGHYANFYPINGTFQNYNPVRRLLDGQIPYRDFNDYLGMGHLYIGSLTTKIFGGTYQDSLVAFSFLTFVGLATLSIVIGRAIFSNWKISLSASNLLLVVLLVKPFFFSNAVVTFKEIGDALNCALGAGNSARFVRGLILPILIAIFLLAFRIYTKKMINAKIVRPLPALITGLIAGFAFIWSNDYGISSWLCLILMVICVSLARNRKIMPVILDMLLAIAGSIISVIVLVEVLSMGHFKDWIKYTFGTGGYQSWYYNSLKSYYLYDVDFSFVMLIQVFAVIIYIIKLFVNKGTKEAVIRYGIPAFINMTCFCAVNEYRLLSGGGCREVALSALFITVFYETVNAFKGVLVKSGIEKKFMVVVTVVCLAWIISTSKDELIFSFVTEEGEYIESMGGNMTSMYADMRAAHEFLDGEDFFSTYASAQEVYEDTYQPTGTDYIIHVLGDEQRETYLNQFHNGDFKYAVTIRKRFTDWECWVERANWFFYRELYENWHPVFSNEYETYWERNNKEMENTLCSEFEVQTQLLSDTTIKLEINTDENVTGIADIYIDYKVDKRPDSRLAKIQFQKMLKVQNIEIHASDSYYESNNLRPASAEYVPMTI